MVPYLYVLIVMADLIALCRLQSSYFLTLTSHSWDTSYDKDPDKITLEDICLVLYSYREVLVQIESNKHNLPADIWNSNRKLN